jgi:hypothetical protein
MIWRCEKMGDKGTNNEEIGVMEDALEHVELVVDLARVEFVEDLHPNKRVEHHGVVLSRNRRKVATRVLASGEGLRVTAKLHTRLNVVGAAGRETEPSVADKHNEGDDDHLINGMDHDILDHDLR